MDIPGVGGGTANMKKASNSDLFNDGETVGSSRRHMKQHSSNSSLMELVENMHRSTISVHSDSSSSSTSKRKVSKNLLSMPNNLSGAHGGNNSIGSTAGGLAPSVSQEFDQGRRSSTILYEMIAKREPPNVKSINHYFPGNIELIMIYLYTYIKAFSGHSRHNWIADGDG